ncbi:M48 family metallopeptidase [Dysgonomonas sp. Marseille-P4677]|uniref:M48 family metallopeptidase n=1 Tax=Dysgonomonas sp. Marseille-P4677 TaxID=2364790 RepID=UPI001912E69F|nr:M48 family metallopeptidase [Dysgonomonas sp. Marseille-P4677]MBK5722375.1 M48 family metallopeptidase [Dysgonomonas sp. Marseille-P4677]
MVITDKDLGEIRLVKNVQARRIIVRRKDGCLQLTYPSGVTMSFIEKTIVEMKPRLLKLLEKAPKSQLFTPDIEFRTFSFVLNLIESKSTSNYYMKLKDAVLTVSCPIGIDYGDAQVQSTIKNFVEKALRYEAKRLFPEKVKYYAQTFGFSFSTVKINKSRTRWGSCSSKKSINLSYYCMLLPEHLVDFVILHELCHTIEMNHGERFWQLLNQITGDKAKGLTKELKAFKMNW